MKYLKSAIVLMLTFMSITAFSQQSYQQIGNQRFYSDGVSSQQIGNQIFYSNGKSCQQIGNQTFCN